MAVFNFQYGLADGERMGSLYNWKMRQKRVLMWRNSDSADHDIALYSCIFVALYKTTWGSVWNCWGKGEELWLSGPRQCLVHRRRMFSASLEEDDDWAQTMITSLTNLRNKQEQWKVVRLNGDLMGKWESNYRQTFCVASDMWNRMKGSLGYHDN